MIDPIREFWRWWTTCPHPDPASIDQHVRAMDAGLGWELTSYTCLTVHANGDPTLRAYAARWAAAAPTSSDWTFLSARPPSATPLSGAVIVDGTRIDLNELVFLAEPSSDRPEVDVTGVHPSFATMPAPTARRLTELALDDLLGETLLDLWVGRLSTDPGVGSVGLVPGEPGAETPAEVTAAGAAVRTTADARHLRGEALLRFVKDFAALGRWRGWTRIGDATARWPLRAARWPRFDTHLAIAVPPRNLEPPWPILGASRGLASSASRGRSSGSASSGSGPRSSRSASSGSAPSGSRPGSSGSAPSGSAPSGSRPGSSGLGVAGLGLGSGLPAARALARALGEVGADGVIVAWEGGGRVAHVYVDGATDAPAIVEASAGRGAVIERGYDPTLAEVRHLAGRCAGARV